MGKFILCSNNDDVDRIANKMKDFFSVSGSYIGNFGKLITYSKLRIKTTNLYISPCGFSAGTGTYIYKEQTGEEALQSILNDFSGDCFSIRENLIGSYCIIISKNDELFIFVDSSNTYNVYYLLDEVENRFIVTTSYYHIAQIVDNIIVDETLFISDWLHTTIGEETIFEGIKKLTGNKFLHFKTERWYLEELQISVRNFDNEFSNKVIKMYSPLNKCFPKTAIFLTGGQDSRLNLALLLALNAHPKVYYGIGDSSDTSTKNDDLNIVKLISEKHELDFNTMNWRNSDQSDKEYYLHKYGELYSIYSFNKNFISEFEAKIDTDYICFGYFGEVFRTIEPIEVYKKDVFSLDEFIDDLYLAGLKTLFRSQCYEGFRSSIYQLFLNVCKEKNLNPKRLTKDDFQKLNTVYRQRWDTIINNFANIFFYSFPFFGDISITNAAENKKYNEKIHSKYLMKCLEGFTPSLLEIPFFSHIKVKTYNSNTYELLDKQISAKIKDRIREKIHNKIIMNFIRQIYYILRNDKKGLDEIKKEYIEKRLLIKELESNINLNQIDFEKAVDALDARRSKSLLLSDYLVNSIRLKQE